MSELLPCPFCGGEAFVNDDPTGNGGKPHMSGNVGLGRLWSVECDECGADAGFWQDRNVAIAAWNSRAERTCRNKVIEINKNTPLEWRTDNFSCSECGAMFFADSEHVNYPIDWAYCPNCGCKVVGE